MTFFLHRLQHWCSSLLKACKEILRHLWTSCELMSQHSFIYLAFVHRSNGECYPACFVRQTTPIHKPSCGSPPPRSSPTSVSSPQMLSQATWPSERPPASYRDSWAEPEMGLSQQSAGVVEETCWRLEEYLTASKSRRVTGAGVWAAVMNKILWAWAL